MTALCDCPDPVQDTLHRDPPRCVTCRGVIVRHAPLTTSLFTRLADDMTSILGRIAADQPVVGDVAADPVRRRDPGVNGRGVVSDPTGAAVVDRRRQTVRDHYALAGWYLRRAYDQLRRADEHMGDALQAADPGPDRRSDDREWWPQITSQNDLELARRYQQQRRARGES